MSAFAFSPSLSVDAPTGVPEVRAGDDLGAIIAGVFASVPGALEAGDVVVLAQKIVSKAEGRYVRLADAMPSQRAVELANATGKDPRLIQLVLDESTEVLRYREGVLVVRHRLGFVMANAGIDRSNLDAGEDTVLLLPRDPDASAARLRAALEARFEVSLAVVVNDSVGRAFRNGTASIALGASGLPSLVDLRGAPDRRGRALEVSTVALADQIACAAALVMGEGAEGRPVARLRGFELGSFGFDATPAADLVRAREHDLFG